MVRTWLRRARYRLHRAIDRVRLASLRGRHEHRFHIVSATYNAAPWIEQHLDSIHEQRYPRAWLHHLVINDASSDDTDARVRAWLDKHTDHSVEYIVNAERAGGCANITRGFRRAPPGSLVLQVDGDDWLPDPEVLAYLDMVYRDPEIWMTYNTWALPDGAPGGHCAAIPRGVVRRNGYRDHPWVSSHLHAFRRELFDHVREEDLLDPTTGKHWTASVDMSHYLPMLELAGSHARHLERITYTYNLNPSSIIQSRRAYQLASEQRIRALKRYRPLTSLRGQLRT
jgi:glycosyltransferase involved in cell wall biosynthesis